MEENQRDARIPLRKRRKLLLTLIGVCIMIVVVTAAVAWILMNDKPIPAKYRSGLDFPLYYPKNIPHDYAVERQSFQRQGKVLIYSLTSPHERDIAVSEEAIPTGYTINQSLNQTGISLPDERTFTTAIGPASYTLWGTHTVISIASQNTWLILNVTGVPPQTAIDIAGSFRAL
jgi:hypothetical protein